MADPAMALGGQASAMGQVLAGVGHSIGSYPMGMANPAIVGVGQQPLGDSIGYSIGIAGPPVSMAMPGSLEQQIEFQQQQQARAASQLQEAASQQAYQFWVQQQLNAQMALFENERSLSTGTKSHGSGSGSAPKKPST